MKITILGIGEFLGDIEIKTKHTDQSYFTVKCLMDQSIVYYLSLGKINNLFIPSILSKFNEGVSLKENALKTRLLFLRKKKVENTINKYNNLVSSHFDNRTYSNEERKRRIVNRREESNGKTRMVLSNQLLSERIAFSPITNRNNTLMNNVSRNKNKNLLKKQFNILNYSSRCFWVIKCLL